MVICARLLLLKYLLLALGHLVLFLLFYRPLQLLLLDLLYIFLTCREATRVAEIIWNFKVIHCGERAWCLDIICDFLIRATWRIVDRLDILFISWLNAFTGHYIDSLHFRLVLVWASVILLGASGCEHGWRHINCIACDHTTAQFRVIVILLMVCLRPRI